MPSLILITNKQLQDYPVLASCAEQKGISILTSPEASDLKDMIGLNEADFVFVAPDIRDEKIFVTLDRLDSLSVKGIVTVCLDGAIDQRTLVELATRVNHIIPDCTDRRVVTKKLSNLISLYRLKNEKIRLKELEKTLEEESAKLVEVNVNNVKLIAEVNEKNKLLDIARKDIQNLLDNLTQGFFTVNRNGIVQPGFSRAVESLFEISPLGRNITELLRMDEKEAKSTIDWLTMLFDEIIPYKDLIALAPREFSFNNRYIVLDFQPIRNDRGLIEKLIVIATDRTREKAFEAKARKEEAFIAMILAVVKDRSAFADFVEDARSIMKQIDTILSGPENKINIEECLRLAHTLKGNSGAFYFTDVKEKAHFLESSLSQLKGKSQTQATLSVHISEYRSQCKELQEAFTHTLLEIKNALGDVEVDASRRTVLENADILRFKETLMRLPDEYREIKREYIDTFIHGCLHTQIGRFHSIISGIAQRMGKEARLVIEAAPVKLHLEPYKPFVQSLIHIFRNALDHGIEPPDEREAEGKPRCGTLTVKIYSADENQRMLQISIADDGRGIDPENVKKSAIKRGICSESELLGFSLQDIFSLLFRSGFSTKSDVTEWSGRGVGLDAVAFEVTRLGGKISVDSVLQKGTTITIFLPVLRLYDFQ